MLQGFRAAKQRTTLQHCAELIDVQQIRTIGSSAKYNPPQ